jgi:ATP-dependent Clp protease ATP-binding subunit ClpA
MLALARVEADRLGHNFVGTEHLLLGILKLGAGRALEALHRLNVDLEAMRLKIENAVAPGPGLRTPGNIPHTPRSIKVLKFAKEEAIGFGHTYVGTEHILLGCLRDGEGVAARVLMEFHVDIEAVRNEILKEPGRPPAPSKTESVDTGKRYDVRCAKKSGEPVVYRHALFKATKSLLAGQDGLRSGDFIELELDNGKTIFISRSSIVSFCECDVTRAEPPASPPPAGGC